MKIAIRIILVVALAPFKFLGLFVGLAWNSVALGWHSSHMIVDWLNGR